MKTSGAAGRTGGTDHSAREGRPQHRAPCRCFARVDRPTSSRRPGLLFRTRRKRHRDPAWARSRCTTRRGWDLNPRKACTLTSLAGRPDQPDSGTSPGPSIVHIRRHRRSRLVPDRPGWSGHHPWSERPCAAPEAHRLGAPAGPDRVVRQPAQNVLGLLRCPRSVAARGAASSPESHRICRAAA